MMLKLKMIFIIILMTMFVKSISTSSVEQKRHFSKDDIFLLVLKQECINNNLDLRVVAGVIDVESRWNYAKRGQLIGTAKVQSYADAYGVMQVQLPTAHFIMKDTTITADQLMTDHVLNIRAGIRYLAWCRDYFDGDLKLALVSYNRGPRKVYRDLARGKNPHNGYARNVLQNI